MMWHHRAPHAASPPPLVELALELILDHMEFSSEPDSPPLAHDDMYYPSSMSDLEHSTAISLDPPLNDSDQDALSSKILPSKYDATDIETIVHCCTHLCPHQQDDLLDVLSHFPKLFNNELNVYPHEKIHLDIDPTVSPHITHVRELDLAMCVSSSWNGSKMRSLWTNQMKS